MDAPKRYWLPHFLGPCPLTLIVVSFFDIFWIFCCKSILIGAFTSAIPTIFTADALPGTTLPIFGGLGQAPNMLACIPEWLGCIPGRLIIHLK